jgi:hypothetical protein
MPCPVCWWPVAVVGRQHRLFMSDACTWQCAWCVLVQRYMPPYMHELEGRRLPLISYSVTYSLAEWYNVANLDRGRVHLRGR